MSTPSHQGSHASYTVLSLLRPLAPFLDARETTELTVNRPGELWTKASGDWERHEVLALSAEHLQALETALVTFNGLAPRSVASLVLPGGERAQIIRPPACIEGMYSLTIRKHMPVVKTLAELELEGVFAENTRQASARGLAELDPLDAELLTLKDAGKLREFLNLAVLAKKNIVIAGATGSGKTTLCRSLIERVPTNERIVTIEDVHELILPGHPNRLHLIYGDGAGRLPATRLLAECMRISPDRIFLAEMRGAEAIDYLSSLNTGHPGGISTVHANSALDAFTRIGLLVKQSDVGRTYDMALIRQMLLATIDVVLFMDKRRVTELYFDPAFARSQMA